MIRLIPILSRPISILLSFRKTTTTNSLLSLESSTRVSSSMVIRLRMILGGFISMNNHSFTIHTFTDHCFLRLHIYHIPLIITSLAHSHLSSIAFYSTNHYPTPFQSLKRRGCRYYQQTITFPIHIKLFTPPINEIITEDLFIPQLPLSACSCSRRDTRHRSFYCQHQ